MTEQIWQWFHSDEGIQDGEAFGFFSPQTSVTQFETDLCLKRFTLASPANEINKDLFGQGKCPVFSLAGSG